MPQRALSSAIDVLIVEDDADLLRLFAAVLNRAGCTVRGTRTAEDALAECQVRLPAILITDGSLPGMSGAELVRLARSEIAGGDAVPVVAVTGTVRSDLNELADVVLLKPFDIRALVDQVRALSRVRVGAAGGGR